MSQPSITEIVRTRYRELQAAGRVTDYGLAKVLREQGTPISQQTLTEFRRGSEGRPGMDAARLEQLARQLGLTLSATPRPAAKPPQK